MAGLRPRGGPACPLVQPARAEPRTARQHEVRAGIRCDESQTGIDELQPLQQEEARAAGEQRRPHDRHRVVQAGEPPAAGEGSGDETGGELQGDQNQRRAEQAGGPLRVVPRIDDRGSRSHRQDWKRDFERAEDRAASGGMRCQPVHRPGERYRRVPHRVHDDRSPQSGEQRAGAAHTRAPVTPPWRGG